MPTYEYACKSCGKHFEVQQSFTDDALTTCPTCGGPLRKVFGNIAISFKGTGFYSTDNRSAGKAGASTAKGEHEPAAASSDGAAKSESPSSDSSSSPSSSSDSAPSKSSSSASDGSPSKSGGSGGGSGSGSGSGSKSGSGSGSGSKSGDKSSAAAAP